VGLGNPLFEFNLTGLDEAEWAQIASVTARFKKPDRSIFELPGLQPNADRVLSVIGEIDVEGDWSAGVRIHFTSGQTLTSVEPFYFRASDGL
jgi:hypothetical protein